jgi:hypothetical protein
MNRILLAALFIAVSSSSKIGAGEKGANFSEAEDQEPGLA